MENLADFLNSELASRKKINEKYSLRAFARDLDLSPSRVCELLANRGGLSKDNLEKLIETLELGDFESHWVRSVNLRDHGASKKDKRLGLESLNNLLDEKGYSSVDLEQFEFISNWYHFAILAAMDLDEFDGKPESIRKKINISDEDFNQAIRRLKIIGLIRERQGLYKLTQNKLKTKSEIPNRGLKISHKQTLKQAIESVDRDPLDKRSITSMTVAIDPKKIPEAKKMIEDFRYQLTEFLEGGERKEIYNINIQLVPIPGLGEE